MGHPNCRPCPFHHAPPAAPLPDVAHRERRGRDRRSPQPRRVAGISRGVMRGGRKALAAMTDARGVALEAREV